MKDVSVAVTTKFNSSIGGTHTDLYTLVSGRFYKEVAAQGVAMPYVVYHIIDNVPTWTFDKTHESIRIQFDLFSSQESSLEVETMYIHLKSLYDWCILVTDSTFISMRRELARLIKDPEDRNWHYIVDYIVRIESGVTNDCC